ncbi:MAG: N-6 DNA methylase [Alphaproteobacteria bacterium]|nr:N-6 DNA methylase [Alphaproteobacteria bacterium]
MKRTFTGIRSEGGLLPGDLLARVGAGDRKLPATDEASYGLLAHETLGEAVNRAWSRLLGAWRAFRDTAERLPEADRGTTLTRERWLLPLFHELGYGRLSPAKAVEADGRSFAVSHAWEQAPIHLVSFRFDLDKRLPGVSGAAASSPHGLLQDLLNRSDEHLWGFVCNGLALRVLRDHHSLTRKAYVEFDLAQIFDGELYSEFRVLWLVCHASRVQGDKPSSCALERWFHAVREEGVAALDKLRGGVEQALVHLGTGLLRHPANRRLRDDLHSGTLSTRELYRQLLRLAYRLIFLFVAEDRGVLLDPDAPREARERFVRFYATRRLRDLADKKRGGPHGDLWVQLRELMGLLHEGYPRLALPAFGSFLWSPTACRALTDAEMANEHLLAGLRALCTLEDDGTRRTVAWNLVSADELGGVYESLMELHPVVRKESDRDTFVLETAPGHERKTTGSYYTPTSLVDCLLDSALDPVLDEAARQSDPEAALLDLKVVDPACGSGHFLVAAARRMAERLARIRTGDAEPAPRDYQHALRDVVGRCIYGVDLNEMAVELCKVALWMEAIEPGKPLSFLDAHIQHGNALLGATPKLLASGVPNDAWKPITGDDTEVAKALRARNRQELKGQGDLWAAYLAAEAPGKYDVTSGQVRRVEDAPDDDLGAVRAKESAWRRLQASPEIKDANFLADLWCAAFVWPKDREHEASAPTHELFRRVSNDAASCPSDTRQEVRRLAREYRFFHWHLAFPAVFTPTRGARSEETGWHSGFDVVLGNPPWERLNISQKEWFAGRAPEIAEAPNAGARRRAIAGLERTSPELWGEWQGALGKADGETSLVRDSGRYPLCGRGDINTYSIFAELNRALLSSTGRAGFIVPSGIATDATTQHYFRAIVEGSQLACLHSFENEEFLFPGVHHAYKFALVSLVGMACPVPEADLVFFARSVADLEDRERHFTLSARDFALLNPNTLTCPTFRWRRDAKITKDVYRRVPVLLRESDSHGNPWGVDLGRMFHMSDDADLFGTADVLEAEGWVLDGSRFSRGSEEKLPLYEAKLVHHFDHRFSTYEGQTQAQANQGKCPELTPEDHADSTKVVLPRYWVGAAEVEARLEGWDRGWLLGWRDICRSTDARTAILSVFPRTACSGTPLCLPIQTGAEGAAAVVAFGSSFAFDYIARQSVGGTHLTYTVFRQLPVLPPDLFSTAVPWDQGERVAAWVGARVLELVFTAWDLASFGGDLGWSGPPFRWDEKRRVWLRAELDAACFHLYGISRDDVEYIMESFWVVRNNDEKVHGSYQTKEAILDRYDAMQRAIDSGEPYQTVLDPPPAHPSLAHDESTRPAWAAAPQQAGQVIQLPVHPQPQPAPVPIVPDLAPVAASAWARPRQGNEVSPSLLAVLKAHGGPMDRREARLAALLCLEPHLLTPMLDSAEQTHWARVVGSDASQPLSASVDGTIGAWGSAIRSLRGRGRIVEDGDTWALGAGADAISTAGWPEGRAGFVVNVLRRLWASESVDATVLRFPTTVRQWLAHAA